MLVILKLSLTHDFLARILSQIGSVNLIKGRFLYNLYIHFMALTKMPFITVAGKHQARVSLSVLWSGEIPLLPVALQIPIMQNFDT